MSSVQKLSIALDPPHDLDPGGEGDDRRILIVDDDEVLRETFASCLMERYSCATAGSAGEALALLAREPVALVIADIVMPGRNGVELLREIIKRFPSTMMIVTSGIDRSQRVRDALRLGAYDYLVKPFDLDALELSVERALEQRSLLREEEQYKKTLEERNIELAGRKTDLERLLAADINAIKEKTGYEQSLKALSSIVNDCYEDVDRIRAVVQNLRFFSRPDEDEFKRVDLHEGIESTIRLLARYFSNGSIALRRDYCGLPLVGCYAGQLNQVWMNLLINAIHAVGHEGHIRISTQLNNRNVLVTISDTGRGITPEHLDKIFDPFFTTKPVGEGRGLGLSITHGIVERHGGSITVKSCPGMGTTFTVTLPI